MGIGLFLGGEAATWRASLFLVTVPGSGRVGPLPGDRRPAREALQDDLVVLVTLAPLMLATAGVVHLSLLAMADTSALVRRSEAQGREIFANAPDANLSLDEDGRVVSLNRAAERVLGLDAPTARGRIADALETDPEACGCGSVEDLLVPYRASRSRSVCARNGAPHVHRGDRPAHRAAGRQRGPPGGDA